MGVARYLKALYWPPLPIQVDQVDSKIKDMGKFYMIKDRFINKPYLLWVEVVSMSVKEVSLYFLDGVLI